MCPMTQDLGVSDKVMPHRRSLVTSAVVAGYYAILYGVIWGWVQLRERFQLGPVLNMTFFIRGVPVFLAGGMLAAGWGALQGVIGLIRGWGRTRLLAGLGLLLNLLLVALGALIAWALWNFTIM